VMFVLRDSHADRSLDRFFCVRVFLILQSSLCVSFAGTVFCTLPMRWFFGNWLSMASELFLRY
jgi:hypothetical protein